MEPHPYGWLSLLPPLIAIALAIVTRKAATSLLLGVFCGALITTGGSVPAAVYDTCEVHLWPTLTDPGKLRVFSFTFLMGAMVGVICRCGGMQGLIQVIAPVARSRRSGQLTTWFLGLLIFFDDYANTILLGNTLRPVCDRLKISREKLAYLVDSTAAPVAGLSLLSTWVAVELEYVREGVESLGATTDWNAIDLFIGSIPYRFYVLVSLVLIPMVALTGRDFGPMLKAERRRLRQSDAEFHESVPSLDDEDRDVPARWYNAVLPIVVTLGVLIWLLYATGKRNLLIAGGDPTASLRDILGAADSSLSLQYGALAGLIFAMLLARVQRLVPAAELMRAAGQGVRIVLPALAILWFASSLSRMTGSRSLEGAPDTTPYEFQDYRLYTGDFLSQKILASYDSPAGDLPEVSSGIMVKMLPTVVFLLAAALSFATGTSYGTMGIMLPMVITLAHALLSSHGAIVEGTNPILLASVGGVLAGAIFGDHCSPISDTTILSSQSCVCDHIAHVVTQLPYAFAMALLAIVFGTIPLGWGVSVWVLLPLQFVAIYVLLVTICPKVESQEGASSGSNP